MGANSLDGPRRKVILQNHKKRVELYNKIVCAANKTVIYDFATQRIKKENINPHEAKRESTASPPCLF